MKIFITYSRTIKNKVMTLVGDLEELGHEVWYDQDLSGGQNWWDNILNQIRLCEIYIFTITQETLDSTACMRELKYAEALNKTPLPILMDNSISMSMVPRYLSNVQNVNYINLEEKNVVFSLVKAISHLSKSPDLPDPLPEPPPVPISYLDTLKEKVDAQNLDKKDQIALVSELKNKLNDPNIKKADIIALFQRLRKHDDLFASVANEIDEIIAQTPTKDIARDVSHVKSPSEFKEEVRPEKNTGSKDYTKDFFVKQPGRDRDKGEKSWNPATMIILVLGTLFLPIIGFIVGLIGIFGGRNRSQSITLFGLAIIMALMYYCMFSASLYY